MKDSVAARNGQLDNLTARLNNGYLRIYSGTKPASADTALSGNTLLAELRFGATAFGAASSGTATANAITQDASADATGTATFARLLSSDGTTAVIDITVGTSGAELNLSTTSIAAGVIVQVTSMTITQPDGT
jgi:hypothetical protein